MDFDDISAEDLDQETMQWDSISEDNIKDNLASFATRLKTAANLLDQMVYKNDYDKTSTALYDLWMYDLGPSGWVSKYLSINKSALGPYVTKPGKPSWYNTATSDEQRAFDAALGYYKDCMYIEKFTIAMRDLMMLYPLTQAFKYMRLTLNLDEAGLGEEWYQNINSDVREVCSLINRSWSGLESAARRAETYYKNQDYSTPMAEAQKEYVMARLGDYKSMFEAAKLDQRFYFYLSGPNAAITAKPVVLAYMRIIDEYTWQISGLGNIEDELNKAKAQVPKISDAAQLCYANCLMSSCTALLDALSDLKDAYWQFNEAAINVYTCYKNRDSDQPYLFMRPIPSYSDIQGTYGFSKPSGDPLSDGTKYYDLYQAMARALTAHCREFSTKHGAPELLP